MKQSAIEKALSRLDRAREHVKLIETSKNFPEFTSAWTDFLLALNSVYSLLEQGAKENPQSRQWFGGKKKERKRDELLNYLHQARNADEHGIEPVAKLAPGHTEIGVGGETVHIKSMSWDGSGNISGEFLPVDGKYPTVRVTAPHAQLVTVTDERFGDKFPPPKTHLGAELADRSPLSVARAGLTYCEELLKEAATYAKSG